MRLELGQRVRASDGRVVAKLADVIIDPIERRVTHLVVRPHRHDDARLVEIERVTINDSGADIALRCTERELHGLPTVDDFAYIRLGDAPVEDPEWDVGVTNVLALPYYEGSGIVGAPIYEENIGVVFDRIPKGEVEIRRSSSVLTEDGQYVGDVDGFIVDGEDQITHFVLERGHLWGRRDVTIPIGAVVRVETDCVNISLSVSEIEKLPAHHVRRWFVFN